MDARKQILEELRSLFKGGVSRYEVYLAGLRLESAERYSHASEKWCHEKEHEISLYQARIRAFSALCDALEYFETEWDSWFFSVFDDEMGEKVAVFRCPMDIVKRSEHWDGDVAYYKQHFDSDSPFLPDLAFPYDEKSVPLRLFLYSDPSETDEFCSMKTLLEVK